MKSVCFVHKDIADIDRGGLCVLFKNLIIGFKEKGWKVSCVTSKDFTMSGISVYKLPENKDPLQYSQEVTKTIEKIEPDFAECSNWRFELLDYARKHNKESRKTKVVVRCDPPATSLFPELQEFSKYEAELSHKANLLIAISKFAKDETERQYKNSEINVVYNGIPLVNKEILDSNNVLGSGEYAKEFYGEFTSLKNKQINDLIDSEKINIFWVGKSTKMKGFDYLLEIIKNSPINFQYIINLGHARNGVDLPKNNFNNTLIVRDLNKNDQLRLWAKTNLFLATSRAEGFGIVVSEALSLGLPVILNKNCVVYKEFLPNPAIQLLDMQNYDKLFESITKMSKERFKINNIPTKFTVGNMIKDTIELYENTI